MRLEKSANKRINTTNQLPKWKKEHEIQTAQTKVHLINYSGFNKPLEIKKLVYFRMNWTLTHDSSKIVTFNCAHRLSFSGAKGKTVYKHPHTIKMSIFRRVNCSSALLGIWFGFVDFPIYFCRTHFSQRLYGFLSRSFNDKQFVCETYPFNLINSIHGCSWIHIWNQKSLI